MTKENSLRFEFVKEHLTGREMFVANVQNEGFDDAMVHVRMFNTGTGDFQYNWIMSAGVEKIDKPVKENSVGFNND